MVNNVTAVIVIVLVTAGIVFCLDLVFGAMNKYGVEKLKEHVQSNNQSQTQVVEDVTNNSENQNDNENNEQNENTENEENTENTQNNE